MVKTGIKKLNTKSKVLACLLLMTGIGHVQGESRIRANNEAYFQDLSAVQAASHAVENITYGEALFLMHSNQDLRALVTLQQEVALNRPLGLYPNLLRARLLPQNKGSQPSRRTP